MNESTDLAKLIYKKDLNLFMSSLSVAPALPLRVRCIGFPTHRGTSATSTSV